MSLFLRTATDLTSRQNNKTSGESFLLAEKLARSKDRNYFKPLDVGKRRVGYLVRMGEMSITCIIVTGEFEDLGADGRGDNIKTDHKYSWTV
jgi:hypothetical protein